MRSSPSSSSVLDRRSAQDFIVRLDADHPGFRDAAYRSRRDAIARAALEHQACEPAPTIDYEPEEDAAWQTILGALAPLHERLVATPMRRLDERLALSRDRLPQLAEVSELTEAATGFRLVPVAGLATPRAFLEALGEGLFPCTQYLRHHARPLYTPEPDVVHELVGHAASLLDERLTRLFRRWGRAAAVASDEELVAIGRVFWHALEFGAVREGGELRAVGAGLLSSCGELASFRSKAELCRWDLDRMAGTPYDPTDYQPRIFVASSWTEFLESLEGWPALRELLQRS